MLETRYFNPFKLERGRRSFGINILQSLMLPVPLEKNPSENYLCWHYVPSRYLKGIMDTGYLAPQSAEVAKRRHEGEWIFFTTATDMGIAAGNAAHQIDIACGQWTRFSYPACRLNRLRYPYDTLLAPHLIRPTTTAERNKQTPGNAWYASTEPILIDDCTTIEATDDNGQTWRTLWINPSDKTMH